MFHQPIPVEKNDRLPMGGQAQTVISVAPALPSEVKLYSEENLYPKTDEYRAPVNVSNPYFVGNQAAEGLLVALEYTYDQLGFYQLQSILNLQLDAVPPALMFVVDIVRTITDYFQEFSQISLTYCYAPPFSQILRGLLEKCRPLYVPEKGSEEWRANELRELKLLLKAVEGARKKLSDYQTIIDRALASGSNKSSDFFPKHAQLKLQSALDYCNAAMRQYVPPYLEQLKSQIEIKEKEQAENTGVIKPTRSGYGSCAIL